MTKADVLQQSNNDAISENNVADSKNFAVADSNSTGSISKTPEMIRPFKKAETREKMRSGRRNRRSKVHSSSVD